jgi:hypothetical protein
MRGKFGEHCGCHFARNACAQIREHGASDFHEQAPIHACRERSELRLREQFVHRRNLAQQFRLLVRNRALGPCIHANISAQSRAAGNGSVLSLERPASRWRERCPMGIAPRSSG